MLYTGTPEGGEPGQAGRHDGGPDRSYRRVSRVRSRAPDRSLKLICLDSRMNQPHEPAGILGSSCRRGKHRWPAMRRPAGCQKDRMVGQVKFVRVETGKNTGIKQRNRMRKYVDTSA